MMSSGLKVDLVGESVSRQGDEGCSRGRAHRQPSSEAIYGQTHPAPSSHTRVTRPERQLDRKSLFCLLNLPAYSVLPPPPPISPPNFVQKPISCSVFSVNSIIFDY